MRPTKITVTGVGISPWIPLDYDQAPFTVGIGCTVSATATYTIEFTFENVYTDTPTVFQHPFLVNQTANANGNFSVPVFAMRLNVSASTGTVFASIIQGSRL